MQAPAAQTAKPEEQSIALDSPGDDSDLSFRWLHSALMGRRRGSILIPFSALLNAAKDNKKRGKKNIQQLASYKEYIADLADYFAEVRNSQPAQQVGANARGSAGISVAVPVMCCMNTYSLQCVHWRHAGGFV